jgi:hypothetical protein
MAIPALKYMVSGAGFPVSTPLSMIIPPGTIVDTSQPAYAALAGMMPIDAVALDQQTADYAVGYGTPNGLNYDPNRVRVGPGVVSRAVDQPTSDWWEKPSHRPGPPWI